MRGKGGVMAVGGMDAPTCILENTRWCFKRMKSVWHIYVKTRAASRQMR